jgi:hypothetical protein
MQITALSSAYCCLACLFVSRAVCAASDSVGQALGRSLWHGMDEQDADDQLPYTGCPACLGIAGHDLSDMISTSEQRQYDLVVQIWMHRASMVISTNSHVCLELILTVPALFLPFPSPSVTTRRQFVEHLQAALESVQTLMRIGYSTLQIAQSETGAHVISCLLSKMFPSGSGWAQTKTALRVGSAVQWTCNPSSAASGMLSESRCELASVYSFPMLRVCIAVIVIAKNAVLHTKPSSAYSCIFWIWKVCSRLQLCL